MRDPNYRATQPTTQEYEKERKRLHGHHPSVTFVTCLTCGTRFWYSGLGKGSHERGLTHRRAARAAWLETPQGQKEQASMRAWEQEHPEQAAAHLEKVGGRWWEPLP